MTTQHPGSVIAGYRIESLIGRGGMAVVYRAEDLRLGRKVALKLLSPQLADNEDFRQRFIQESRLAASLDHPNIVPIYEAGEADEGVENAGDNGGLAAENPGDEVEFENADQAPIQGADDGKDQCDGIHSLCNLQFFYDAPSISNSGGIIRRRGANFCTANPDSQLKIY